MDDTSVRGKFGSSTHPSAAVIETVARALGCEPTELGQLFDAVDLDALDALVTPSGVSAIDGVTTVSFTYAGRRVAVRSVVEVVVRSADDGA